MNGEGHNPAESEAARSARLDEAVTTIDDQLAINQVWDAAEIYTATQREFTTQAQSAEQHSKLTAIRDTLKEKLSDEDVIKQLQQGVAGSLQEVRQAIDANDLLAAQKALATCESVSTLFISLDRQKFKFPPDLFKLYNDLKAELLSALVKANANKQDDVPQTPEEQQQESQPQQQEEQSTSAENDEFSKLEVKIQTKLKALENADTVSVTGLANFKKEWINSLNAELRSKAGEDATLLAKVDSLNETILTKIKELAKIVFENELSSFEAKLVLPQSSGGFSPDQVEAAFNTLMGKLLKKTTLLSMEQRTWFNQKRSKLGNKVAEMVNPSQPATPESQPEDTDQNSDEEAVDDSEEDQPTVAIPPTEPPKPPAPPTAEATPNPNEDDESLSSRPEVVALEQKIAEVEAVQGNDLPLNEIDNLINDLKKSLTKAEFNLFDTNRGFYRNERAIATLESDFQNQYVTRVDQLTNALFAKWQAKFEQRTFSKDVQRFVNYKIDQTTADAILNSIISTGDVINNKFDAEFGSYSADDSRAKYIDALRKQVEAKVDAAKQVAEKKVSATPDQSIATEAEIKQQEFNAWEQRVQPLVNAIAAVENETDIEKVRPHSTAQDAKNTQQLQVYKDRLVQERNNILTFLQKSKYVGVNEPIVAEISSLIDSPNGRYPQALSNIESQLAKSKRDEKAELETKDPSSMTPGELARASAMVYTENSEWAQRVKNEYIRKKSREEDQVRRARNELIADMPAAELAGDSQKRDWATDYNKVIGPIVDRGVTLNHVYNALFVKPKEDGTRNTEEDVLEGRLEIDTRTIDLWNYIIGRIKGKLEYDGIPKAVVEVGEVLEDYGSSPVSGGILYDATGGIELDDIVNSKKHKINNPQGKYIIQFEGESDREYQSRLRRIKELDQDFSYRNLIEYATENFEAQLKLIFRDIDPEKRSIAIDFFKTFGAKTVGYQPHLMRATTRGHGFAITEKSPSDESRFINPFALIMYNATRYANLKLARYMSRYYLVPKEEFTKLVSQISGKDKRVAELAWDVMAAYRKAIWDGDTPEWVEKGRDLFRGNNPDINIDGTIFPVLPEMVINITLVENEKRLLLQGLNNGSISEQQFINEVKNFVSKYEPQGYASGSIDTVDSIESAKKALTMFGQNKIVKGEVDPGQYNLAAEAVDKMFKFFEKPMSELSHKAAKEKFGEWMSAIIGKAKLVPGNHQLLFVPFTCEVITTICNVYEHRNDRTLVNNLFIDLMEELEGAGGVPTYAKREVFAQLGGKHGHAPKKAPRYMTRYSNDILTAIYRSILWKFESRDRKDIGTRLKRLIPFYSGSETKMFDYALESPYEEHIEKSEDTTKN